ncbi:MAG TPA: helix-hairpin-helix domain-containing protein [Aggregatilineales bacterium]|nr:helix-hairpin-helix domain-containing protein [Aggregatilineales bacterium]
MQVRQKLTEFEGSLAFAVGGGMALIIMAFLLSAAAGASGDPTRFGVMIFVGALLMVGGTVVWAARNRPWTTHDDWSEPLYLGHEHDHHAEAPTDDHAESHAAGHDDHAHHTAHAASGGSAAALTTPEIVPSMAISAAVSHAIVEAAKPAEAPAAKTPAPTFSEASPIKTPDYAPNLPTVPTQTAEAAEPTQAVPPKAADKPAEAEAKPDDLTKVEGIGKKIAGALNAAGVTTFARLATMDPAAIEKIVKDAGVRMVGHANTFPKQAKLAAEGKWDELERLQGELKGGRDAAED